MSCGMIPADLFRIQWVSDTRITPDGHTVAFTVTRLDEEADDYRSAIWVVPADGSTPPRRFTNGRGKDSAPRWSPDGTRLAFLSDCTPLLILHSEEDLLCPIEQAEQLFSASRDY